MTLLNPLQRSHETSRERWVRRTRESVARQMVREGCPATSVEVLEGNLDITRFMPSLGIVDDRTRREISAALNWLVKNGYAEITKERRPEDPSGQLYQLTSKGREMAAESLVYDEVYVQRRGL